MSGVKGRTGKHKNHKKTPVIWNGQRFESRKELESKFGLQRGYLGWYLNNDKPFKGYHVDLAI